jgi:hypothetical protein
MIGRNVSEYPTLVGMINSAMRTLLGIVGVIALGSGYFMWMGAATVETHLLAASTFLGGVTLLYGSGHLTKRSGSRPTENKDNQNAN